MPALQPIPSARPTTSNGRAFTVHHAAAPNHNATPSPPAATNLPTTINPFLLAMSKYRRHQYTACITLCTDILAQQPYDKAAYLLKLKALTAQAYIDDTDFDDESLADQLLDENSINKMARPGTSLKSAGGAGSTGTGRIGTGTALNRPTSGYVRIGTQSSGRQGTAVKGGRDQLSTALRSGLRPGTTSGSNRPTTTNGRAVRLGTQSMLVNGNGNGEFIDINRIDTSKYNVKDNKVRQGEGKILSAYLMYVAVSYKHAAELASVCTGACGYADQYWKHMLGKIYYGLGMYRDAEKQLLSHNKLSTTIQTCLQLAKLYIKLDQPVTAIAMYTTAREQYKHEVSLMTGQARIHDQLRQHDLSTALYKQALQYNSINVEAIACLARQHFYCDAPEIALRLYQRLLQLGLHTCELYNNIGLCAFYSQQYDLALSAYTRALAVSDDSNVADVWYNISHVFIQMGDVSLATQCLKLCISVDSGHGDAWTNMGVIELYKNNIQQAKAAYGQACKANEQTYEAFYNNALLAFKLGDFQDAFQLVHQALQVEPAHTESKELLKQLNKSFNVL